MMTRFHKVILNQVHVLTDKKPVIITQSTQNTDGQEIQTVIVSLNEDSQTIEFD